MSIEGQSESGTEVVLAETVDGLPMIDPTAPAPEPETVARPRAKPVEAAERVASVDVIRGVALLGILAMNINGFAWPDPVYSVPTADPDAGRLDVALWAFNHVVLDTKMMTLFSMLFGAGLVLMSGRAEGRGARVGWVFYRRTFWLLAIGIIHAYLIWGGDVLVIYAECGFLLYLFRKLRPRTLIITGVCCNLMFIPMLLGFKFVAAPYMERTAEKVRVKAEKKEAMHWWPKAVSDAWEGMKDKPPKRETFVNEILVHRGPYPALVRHEAKGLIWGHTLGFFLGFWWFAGGRMLIGMGLMKLGAFSAMLSRRAYLWMIALGYGVGLPVMVFDVYHQAANEFFVGHGLSYTLACWPILTILGALPVVFGHIGLVMLVCQSGTFPWLTRRLAAVGRMALSNYLFDSILCTAIFYGWGLDLYAIFHRPALYVFVLAIWAFQLAVSPLWLSVFRFGPAEWLWRSLTYWKPQPIWATPAGA